MIVVSECARLASSIAFAARNKAAGNGQWTKRVNGIGFGVFYGSQAVWVEE